MSQPYLPVRTKLVPPRLRPHFVARPRLTARLKQSLDYPLTVVKADAGYGKSTALAAYLAEAGVPYAWYSLAEPDADPLIFLLHLVHALRGRLPACGEQSLALLRAEGGARQMWAQAVDALINDLFDGLDRETVLVLDDYHIVDSPDINAITDRLVEQLPPRLHVILATRATPALPSRVLWRVHDELLQIKQSDLAFTSAEVTHLFAGRYRYQLSELEASALTAETEGWIIALQMIAQHLPAMAGQSLERALSGLPRSLSLLFAYLAGEILAKQPAEIQEFLLKTAALRRLDADVCAELLDWSEARTREALSYLDEHSLFVIALGAGAYRYHHLFHQFLVQRAEQIAPAGWRELHRKAALAYRRRADTEEAVYHLLASGESAAAASLLAEIGRAMIASGRWETLAEWLDRLPAEQLQRYPDLLVCRGEAHRLSSEFAQALSCYQAARRYAVAQQDSQQEIKALLGQVMVYLDTVQPALAGPILAEARRLARSDPRAKAGLLELTAENLTNAGRLRQALWLQHALARVCSERDGPVLDPRTLARSGRLLEAQALVEQSLQLDRPAQQQRRAPRSHRESTVLLSWIEALLGQADAARLHAEQGLRLARDLRAPIVEAAALARLGHAHLAGADANLESAAEFYGDSLRLCAAIGVPRFRAEALLGLVVAAGMRGQLADGEEHARQALTILDAAGDRYLTAIVWLGLGGAAVACKDDRAVAWLERAGALSARCGDAYGVCVAQTWRALWHLDRREWPRFEVAARAALEVARQENYGFIFMRQTLFGPKQLHETAALLIAANRRSICPGYSAEVLREMGSELPLLAPGVPTWSLVQPGSSRADAATLHVQTLGLFRVWRGEDEIPHAAWGREKALQLFQILLIHRDRPLHREQLADLLWPGGRTTGSALRVVLNALRQALEPDRVEEAESQLVLRQGESIMLNPDACIVVDADEFERQIENARQLEARDAGQAVALYRRALQLYRGDFLPDTLYQPWSAARRDTLAERYLSTASHLAELLTDQGLYDEAIGLCNAILARDSCWEEAYYLLMVCYARQGKRSLALRAYARCGRHLRAELGVAPAERTQQLFQALSNRV
jgi:LuxR family maltose regulon positive regulatory protein